MSSIQWSTVSYVKDTPEAVRRFVSYHLGLGAAAMYLFFDDPNDPCIEMLSGLNRVHAIPCDQEFWSESLRIKEPKRHGRRQNLSTAYGYGQIREGWVLNFDVDEFLHTGECSVAKFLGAFEDNVRVVRLRPAERILVQGIRENETYRLPVDRKLVRNLRSGAGKLTVRNGGFVGHTDGKSFIRAGMDGLHIRQHWPEDSMGNVLMDRNIEAHADCCILHRNAEPFDIWCSKLEFRLETPSMPGRLAEQIRGPWERGDEGALRQIYFDLFVADQNLLSNMQAHGAVFTLDQPLNRFEEEFFPGAQGDCLFDE